MERSIQGFPKDKSSQKGWDLDEHAGVRQDSLQELIVVCF